MMLDDVFTLHADKPDALYFAVDLADADLDEFGRQLLAEQEKRREAKTKLYAAGFPEDVVDECMKDIVKDKRGWDVSPYLVPVAPPVRTMVCPEKPRTEKSQSRANTSALNAPVLESGATITTNPAPPATEYWLPKCDGCGWHDAPQKRYESAFDCQICRNDGKRGRVEWLPCDKSGREIAAGSGKRWFMSDYGGFFEIDGKKLTFVQDNGERICQAPGQDAIVLSAPWCHEITESAALALLGGA